MPIPPELALSLLPVPPPRCTASQAQAPPHRLPAQAARKGCPHRLRTHTGCPHRLPTQAAHTHRLPTWISSMVPISSASCLPSARLSGKAAVLKEVMWLTCGQKLQGWRWAHTYKFLKQKLSFPARQGPATNSGLAVWPACRRQAPATTVIRCPLAPSLAGRPDLPRAVAAPACRRLTPHSSPPAGPAPSSQPATPRSHSGWSTGACGWRNR